MKMVRHAVAHPISKYLHRQPSSLRHKPRFQPALPTFAAGRLLLLLCGWFVPAAWPNAAAQTRQEKPVAIVGDEALYEKDFLPQIQGQVNKIRLQEHELRRKALLGAINKKLVQKEAQKRGVTEAELLRQEVDSKVAEPTEAEVEQVWAEQMFQGNRPMNEGKEPIRQQLKQERAQQAREEYFQSLREQAGVKIYLLPPRVEVGYDPARVRGNPDAQITIVEFSDFQCPYCLQAYSTVKDILKKYAGKVKLAYRDLPLQEIGSGAPGSAEASRCAGEQGKFWEYHDLLFENQDYFGEEAFREYATTLELDVTQFTTCMESGKFKPPIKEDFQEGIRLGITGTPAFFINGIMVNGAQPQSEFEEIIDVELATM